MTQRMHGRTLEWNEVERLLGAAQEGRGGVLLVEGGRGTGKSALLGQAASEAGERDFTVVAGDADDLNRLVSSASSISPENEDPQLWTAEQLRVIDGLRGALKGKAGRGPVLVALDDAQGAGSTTLMALRLLTPRMRSLPLVWMLARRSGEGGPVLDRTFSMLEEDGATRLELGPLPAEVVEQIVTDLAGAAPGPDLRALAQDADGNPFLLVELVEGLRDEGGLAMTGDRVGSTSGRLPRRVHVAVLDGLAGLSPDACRLLDVVAVLGRSFSVEAAAGASGESPGRLLPGFREALEAGVLVPAGGEDLAFRCGLCRRVLAESIPEPVRYALTRRFDAGSQPVDVDRDVDRFTSAAAAVEAAVATGRVTEAAALARAALAEQPPTLPAAGLRCALSSTLLLSGRASSAVMAADAVLADPELPEELVIAAGTARLWALTALGDVPRARELAHTLAESAERPSGSALAAAQVVRSFAAWSEGRLGVGLDLAEDAVGRALGEPANLRQAGFASPRWWLATMLAAVGRFQEADETLRIAGEEVALLGDGLQVISNDVVRAHVEFSAGRLEAAAETAEVGLAAASGLGAYLLAPPAQCVLAAVALRRGDVALAARHVQRFRSQLDSDPVTFGSTRYTWVEAQLAEAQDGPEAAVDVLAGTYEGLPTDCRMLIDDPTAAAWMVRTAVAAGDQRRGAAVVTAAEQLAAANPGFPTLAAAAAHAGGLFQGDAARLLSAVSDHRHPWARASAAEDAGALLAAHGDRDQALGVFDKSMASYEQSGAERDVSRVRSRLRRIGVRRRHWRNGERPVCGWASLTDTEQSVAAVVSEGLTNRQVADRMFLSPHTVDFHLRQIFRKLDIRSRVELTRLVLERPGELVAS